MRKIIVSEFVSLDGIMEDPGGAEKYAHGGWTRAYWSDEIGKIKYDELMASDALLLGRVTYEGFAKAWPTATDTGDFGERMNSLPKVVVSKTLKAVEWKNSSLIQKNAIEEIAKLKEQPGRDILVEGSSRLVQLLAEHDLVDGYTLLVYPVTLGEGKRLFGLHSKLQLVETKSVGSGVVLLRYQPDRK